MFVPKTNGDKKTQCKLYISLPFLEKKRGKWPYFEEKNHMMPYLDSEFLLVTNTEMDSKKIYFSCSTLTFNQIWLILIVDYL
jgi:hypothetical protein